MSDTIHSMQELLKLSHLTKQEAKLMGLLFRCPECSLELIRHNGPDYRNCLHYLAEKHEKDNRNPLK